MNKQVFKHRLTDYFDTLSGQESFIEVMKRLGWTTDDIVNDIMSILPPNSEEAVHEFQQTFRVETIPKEEKEIMYILPKKIVRRELCLIIEEVAELAQALGIDAMTEATSLFSYASKRMYKSKETSMRSNKTAHYANWVEVLDALVDIRYVVDHAVNTFSLREKYQFAIDEVHRSNMTKVHTDDLDKLDVQEPILDGEPCEVFWYGDGKSAIVKRKSDGKIMKPLSYSSANLKQFIDDNGQET